MMCECKLCKNNKHKNMIYFFTTSNQTVIATQVNNVLSANDIEKLCWLYGEATPVQGETMDGYFVGPRREMITPWM